MPSPLAPNLFTNSAILTVLLINCLKVSTGFCSNKCATEALASWSYSVLDLLKCLAASKINSSSLALPTLLP